MLLCLFGTSLCMACMIDWFLLLVFQHLPSILTIYALFLLRYKDATKTAFKSSTRLECMMQDYPKTLPPSAEVGFTVSGSFCLISYEYIYIVLCSESELCLLFQFS